jgi:hypothetical protein
MENTSLRVGDIIILIGVFSTIMVVWNIFVTRQDNKARFAKSEQLKEREEENARREKEVRSFVKIEEQIAHMNNTMIRIETKIDKNDTCLTDLISKYGVVDNSVAMLTARFDKFETKCQNVQDQKIRERLG